MELPWLLHRLLCSGLSTHACTLQPSAHVDSRGRWASPLAAPIPRLPHPVCSLTLFLLTSFTLTLLCSESIRLVRPSPYEMSYAPVVLNCD